MHTRYSTDLDKGRSSGKGEDEMDLSTQVEMESIDLFIGQ